MRSRYILNVVLGALVALALLSGAGEPPAGEAPQYDADGRLLFPADYRDWIFLSSGLDMSYSANPAMASGHIFDNTFVPRAAYLEFLKSGTWPDKTIIFLENRGGGSDVSINKRGVVQTGELAGYEAHVKDTQRFKGGWGFFAFDGDKPAEMIRTSASCYSCHQAHGAVDTTFVQFYPTLLAVATKLGTLSPAYVKETKADK
ncbi:MAG TPA: cytochrome P460 family protein [Rhizomicrobium sp.]|nr:cytochrome P460 family protein [Rhizomicrobium sp.]